MTLTELQKNRLTVTDTEHIAAGQRWSEVPDHSAPNVPGSHVCAEGAFTDRDHEQRGSATFRKTTERGDSSKFGFDFASSLVFRDTLPLIVICTVLTEALS